MPVDGDAPPPGLPHKGGGEVPITFADLPGWQRDDHAGALTALAAGAAGSARGAEIHPSPAAAALAHLATAAQRIAPRSDPATARAFFEAHFTPHRIKASSGEPGLVTGYFEPEVAATRTRTPEFPAPLYRRPPDLINLLDESQRGAAGGDLTHARRTPAGPVPYATRAQIDAGHLDGQGLELAFLADPVEAFLMQVQGSGRLLFPDGAALRVGYDGKNGHPYTSIGRTLIADGAIGADAMSLASLAAYLRAEPERGRAVMQRNASFVFFRALEGAEAAGPLGVHAIPLTRGRSLAVDTSFHAIGTPVFVSAPELPDPDCGAQPFARLMIAQDVGSAIRGSERGDIFFGTGARAGALAGVTKHACRFVVLLPNQAMRP